MADRSRRLWMALILVSGSTLAGPRGPSRARPAEVPAEAPRFLQQTEASGCPEGMVRVRGNYTPDVDEQCLEWAPNSDMRCLRFRQPTRPRGRRRPVDVCMDTYEWPNREGARPDVMVTWLEARSQCQSVGKRLCTETEWTFACEGEDAQPYPYGYDRDATACNIDRSFPRPNRHLISMGNRAEAAAETARVYSAVPSGSMARCVSPTGVHDMTGNVDEWTASATGRPFVSALKGGWWGYVRTRCRPTTRSHNEHFRYYQIGFRCCADPR